jgi:hypothetical protein
VNPFPPGPARQTRYFFGRSEALASLGRFIADVQDDQSANVMGLLAAPGFGKTCLLKHMQIKLQERNWLCGYSEASPDPGTAIVDLLADVGRSLGLRRRGSRFPASLQEFSVSAGPVAVGFKRSDPDEGTAYARLQSLLYSLGLRAWKAGTGVVLFIDEAQVFPTSDLELLLRAIRNLQYRQCLPIAVVLAGLPDILLSSYTPFAIALRGATCGTNACIRWSGRKLNYA